MKHLLILFLFLALPWSLFAQIGEHRNTLSVGPTAGWNITNIKFTPKVEQKGFGGFSGGVALRYTVEKYFSTICSIQLELNYAQMGWKEDIKDINNNPVINATTGAAENYSRTINYIQVPLLAHLDLTSSSMQDRSWVRISVSRQRATSISTSAIPATASAAS